APFARAGLHVELKERVPDRLGEVAAREPIHRDARRQRVAPLTADGLALARRQRLDEGVEARIAVVLPVELLVGAMQEFLLAQKGAFVLGQEGEVDRRGLVPAA